MGLLNLVFGKSVSQSIDALGHALDKVSTTDEERLQAQAVLERLRQQPALLQAEINKTSAVHRSWFVAGGRPALLWVAAIGWLVEFIVNPLAQLLLDRSLNMPVDQMVWLTGAVLGIYGTLRTFEKVGGVSK